MVSNGFEDGWGGGVPKITSFQILAAGYRSKVGVSTPRERQARMQVQRLYLCG